MDYGWNWITDRIALGGEIQFSADVRALQAGGITHVINCREICDPAYSERALVTCWPNPRQPDDGEPRGVAWFNEGIEFWKGFALDPTKKVYVHCHAGLNRSASMVYALLRSLGLGRTDARLVIVSNRPMDAIGIRYAAEADAALK